MRYLLGEIPDTWHRINIIIANTFGVIISLPGIVIMYNEMIHNNFVLIHDMNEHIGLLHIIYTGSFDLLHSIPVFISTGTGEFIL